LPLVDHSPSISLNGPWEKRAGKGISIEQIQNKIYGHKFHKEVPVQYWDNPTKHTLRRWSSWSIILASQLREYFQESKHSNDYPSKVIRF
jgi:hypothetical protein